MSAIDDMGLYLAYERGYEQGCKERQRSYQDGYDKAVDMACEWLEENMPNKFEDVQNYVDNFRKAMKGGER